MQSYNYMTLSDACMEPQSADAHRALPHLCDREGAGHLQPPHHIAEEAALSYSRAAACVSEVSGFILKLFTCKLRPYMQSVFALPSDTSLL